VALVTRLLAAARGFRCSRQLQTIVAATLPADRSIRRDQSPDGRKSLRRSRQRGFVGPDAPGQTIVQVSIAIMKHSCRQLGFCTLPHSLPPVDFSLAIPQ
jgi:hypothetical protein